MKEIHIIKPYSNMFPLCGTSKKKLTLSGYTKEKENLFCKGCLERWVQYGEATVK